MWRASAIVPKPLRSKSLPQNRDSHARQAALAPRRPGRRPATRRARPGPRDATGSGEAVRVSRARATQLMRTFGAELAGSSRVLPRADLLRQLKKLRGRAAFRNEEQRRARVVAELRQARLTGIRVAVPVESLEARLAGLPEGVTVEAGPHRGAVRGGEGGRREALRARSGAHGRLRALRGPGREGGEVGMSEALVPAPSAGRVEIERPGSSAVALPAVIVDAGPEAVGRFLEYFAAAIANGRTRAAYGRAVGRFWPGAASGASICGRSRRSTSPPTSGRTRGRCRPSSSTWPPFGRSATGSSSTRCCP